MLVLNIFCCVCKVQFKNDDAVHSTSCGHIFHFTCMNHWQCRSTICPVCRTYYPTTYRIYLNFEDLCDNNFEAKLMANKKQIAEMQAAIKRRDKKIDEIQRLYHVSEEWRAEMQDKIANLLSNPEYELHSKADGKGSECVWTENSKLRKQLNASEAVSIGLNQKIEELKLKLKLVTEELKKRIEENEDQSVNNIERNCSASLFEESMKPTKKDQGLKLPKKVFNINKSSHMDNGSKTISPITNIPGEFFPSQILFPENKFPLY